MDSDSGGSSHNGLRPDDRHFNTLKHTTDLTKRTRPGR